MRGCMRGGGGVGGGRFRFYLYIHTKFKVNTLGDIEVHVNAEMMVFLLLVLPF